jgi:hypothetical protein
VHSISCVLGTHGEAVRKTLRAVGIEPTDSRNRTGPANPNWKTGKHLTPDGYVKVGFNPSSPYRDMWGKGRYIPEHRLVMAEHLGRSLYPYEHVHHINGNKSDNRIENLELWESDHPYGQRAGDIIRQHCPTCQCQVDVGPPLNL